MQTLKFIVDKQSVLKLDDFCKPNLIPGSAGYVKAEFSFPPEWNGFVKVAEFFSSLGKEYPPQLLTDGKTCLIPTEALAKRIFKIRIVGKKDDRKLLTNKIVVIQNGDKI